MKNSTLRITLIFTALIVWWFSSSFNSNNDLIKYVDPFIGSSGHGHVFVGATVPFGGVQVGPTNFN